MMKISVHESDQELRFELEGRLEGAWVAELEKAWLSSASRRAARRAVLDLNAVSFIDQPGRLLLRRMHREGARLEAALPLTQAIVEEIIQ